MSTSTVVLKKPGSGYSCEKRVEKYSTNFVAMILWGMAALVNSVHPTINHSRSGILLSVNAQDVLVMLLATYLLAKGLKESIYWLVLPWICISVYNMYTVQYEGAYQMYDTFKVTRIKDILPWSAWGCHVVGLVIRAVLVVRVALLVINQWYHVKLSEALRK